MKMLSQTQSSSLCVAQQKKSAYAGLSDRKRISKHPAAKKRKVHKFALLALAAAKEATWPFELNRIFNSPIIILNLSIF